jgi:hypothetical protein
MIDKSVLNETTVDAPRPVAEEDVRSAAPKAYTGMAAILYLMDGLGLTYVRSV